jgi:hypothetical protein
MFRLVTVIVFSVFIGAIISAQISGESKPGYINITKDKPAAQPAAKPVEKSIAEGPVINIISPTLYKGVRNQVFAKQIDIIGKVETRRGIFEVLVNGIEAYVSQDGSFRSTVLLIVGNNELTIEATDGRQNTSSVTYNIERISTTPSTTQSFTSKKAESLDVAGKYYALIIAINEYDDYVINDLDQPMLDAQKLYNTLVAQYTFDQQNIKFLKNVKRNEIIIALDELSKIVTPDDNLLIFYAGHGYWDKQKETGYWLPADAQQSNTANWLRNTTMQGYIDDINSRHTLLITDACFGGSIFKTRRAFSDAPIAINKLYDLPSRKAMTSGTLEEVPDKSVFLEFLLKRLQQNDEKYLSTEELFTSFRAAVLNNSPNVPQYGTIQNTGDEGGDFIFIKR